MPLLKAVIVFCLIGIEPCTVDNATYSVDKGGSFKFCPHAQASFIKDASRLSQERGNTEYFKILCVPAE